MFVLGIGNKPGGRTSPRARGGSSTPDTVADSRLQMPHAGLVEGIAAGIFSTCANAQCQRSWLRLWRSRSVPVFEGGWTCSIECTAACMQAAVDREWEGQTAAGPMHRHRVPLGLLMMEKGWISRAQLREALDAQRAAGTGRLGYWLMRQHATDEETVTRALSLQWSCPMLGVDMPDRAILAGSVPRLLLDAFGALPLRLAGGKVLYIGFEECLDPILAFAVERMTGLRVESGIVRESAFRSAHAQILQGAFPAAELVEAVSPLAATHALAKSVERVQPLASRLVRVHDCLWMRMWKQEQHTTLPQINAVEDVICSIGDLT